MQLPTGTHDFSIRTFHSFHREKGNPHFYYKIDTASVLGIVHLRRRHSSPIFWPLPPHVEYIGRRQITKEGKPLPPGRVDVLNGPLRAKLSSKWHAIHELYMPKSKYFCLKNVQGIQPIFWTYFWKNLIMRFMVFVASVENRRIVSISFLSLLPSVH